MEIADIHAEFAWRDLIHQTTDEQLAKWLLERPRVVYAGFDPTADSLHVGSLLPLMLLRRMQRAGHQPIALVGGATGMIGDPSGKSEERNLMSVAQLRANVVALESQIGRFLDFEHGERPARLVNNFDWMRKFSCLDFLRDIGKHFPVGAMLGKDSVRSRLERDDAGMSYTEFSYMLLQAYDFVHLHQHHGCELQIGGSDQWGNITAGIELGRRVHNASLYGMTCPLLLDSEGKKIGKTEEGTKVWLSRERTSPYQFYQYWIQRPDADAGRCLRYLTELSREEIESLDASRQEEPGKALSQQRLAQELTRLVHGEEGLAAAEKAKQVLFGGEIDDADDQQLLDIFADVPSSELPRSELSGEGIGILDAFVRAGLAKSNGEARRTVKQGGAYVNNRRVSDSEMRLTGETLDGRSVVVLRSGKKRYALLRIV